MIVPPFSFTGEYFLFLLSITLTTLGLLTIGGLLRGRVKSRPSLKKKLLGFPLFVAGIFGMGWLTERIQQGIFTYLKENVATSVAGIIITVLVAWLLYDWVLWRR